MESLAGKSALITGGARRVGAAIARRLHAAGASVLIHYRDSEADAVQLIAELNAARAGSAAKVKAELLAPIAPRVRVNGVAPGAIAWPEDGQFEPVERARIVATTPLGRVGAPADIAQAVHFLACAPYVTGEIIAVDGGRSIYL